VDPSGYNLKKAQGLKNDGMRQNHDSFVNILSSWLARARKLHMGGSNGKPRTCKGLFSRISNRLSQLEEARTPKGMLFGVYADDSFSWWRALRGFRNTLKR